MIDDLAETIHKLKLFISLRTQVSTSEVIDEIKLKPHVFHLLNASLEHDMAKAGIMFNPMMTRKKNILRFYGVYFSPGDEIARDYERMVLSNEALKIEFMGELKKLIEHEDTGTNTEEVCMKLLKSVARSL